MTRTDCPLCDNDETEFVQFGSGTYDVTIADEEDVGDGILELRSCNDCGTAIENVLTVENRFVFQHDR